MRMSGYKVEYVLIEYKSNYYVYAFATVQNAATYAYLKDIWVKLGRMIWGLPGQIQVTADEDDTTTLTTSLAYRVEEFSEEDEAVEWLNRQTEPDFQGFFDDIYGDG